MLRAALALVIAFVFSVAASAVLIDGADGSADLAPFPIIYPWPDLPPLEIRPLSPVLGSLLLVVGNGRDRGSALVWDPNGGSAPGPTEGYGWAPSAHVRWGTNNFEVYPAGGKVFNTYASGSLFDAGRAPQPEAQAVPGDSGGAVFTLSLLGQSELTGVILGIVQYSGQPGSTSFFGQKTYYADLAYYRPRINDAVELPESDRMLAPGAALLGWLGVRRRRAAASGRGSAGAAAPAPR